jgi:4-hydroxybenzoate polyprenyltransferase
MLGTALLNLLRRNWWLLALVAWAAWMIESIIAGNNASEILTGSLLVCIWVTAIVSIDRWIVRTADREEPRQ